MNLEYEHTIYPEWKGLPIVPSFHAIETMGNIGMHVYDIANLLENGKGCEEKRKDDTYTICERWARRELKIVVTKNYSGLVESDAWIVVTIIIKR